MDETNRIKFTKIGIIVGLIIIVIVPLIIFIVQQNNKYTPSQTITIENIYDELPDITPDAVQSTEQSIYTQLTLDLDDNIQTPTSGAFIRTDSLHIFPSTDDIHTGTFIVDIPSAEWSYLVNYYYGDSYANDADNNAILFCLSDTSQILYPNSACNDSSDLPNQNNLWLYISSYSTTLPSDRKNITLALKSSSTVAISANQCSAQSVDTSATTVAQEWLTTLGFDPTKFSYEIELNYNRCLAQ